MCVNVWCRQAVPLEGVAASVCALLDTIQREMLERARRVRDERLAVITECVGRGGLCCLWCGAAV